MGESTGFSVTCKIFKKVHLYLLTNERWSAVALLVECKAWNRGVTSSRIIGMGKKHNPLLTSASAIY